LFDCRANPDFYELKLSVKIVALAIAATLVNAAAPACFGYILDMLDAYAGSQTTTAIGCNNELVSDACAVKFLHLFAPTRSVCRVSIRRYCHARRMVQAVSDER
jgi:hypothetical protein